MMTTVPNLLNAEKLADFVCAYIPTFSWEIDRGTLAKLILVRGRNGAPILTPPCGSRSKYQLLDYPVIIVSYVGISLVVATGQRSQRYDLYEHFGFYRREEYYG